VNIRKLFLCIKVSDGQDSSFSPSSIARDLSKIKLARAILPFLPASFSSLYSYRIC
jgi:hypothetical protein